MKKIISLILALTMCFSAAALLASCAGESAYEIAVRNGFTGTEEEWIASLKGDKGAAGDKGATGDKGDKGDAGVKGDAGAPGEKGDKGDKGPQGDQGAAGSNGNAGNAGANGADALPIEIQTNETHIQWRYVGETEWKNLIALEALKGEKGDQGEAGKDGVDGPVPHVGEDGLWWIGDQPTNIVAGTPENGGAVETVSVTSLEFTGLTPVDADGDGNIDYFETSVWGNWPAEKAVKPMLKYTLSNGRSGTTELKPSMVKGTYNLSKGGTYKPTVTFLGFTQEIEIRVTSYTFQTEWEVVGEGEEDPTLILETILPTGASSTKVISEENITSIGAKALNFKEIGKYTVEITIDDLDPERFDIIVHPKMVYFESFNGIEGEDTDSILSELGWTNRITTPLPTNSIWSTKGVKLDLSNTGLNNPKSLLSMEDGMLKIDNTSENESGLWAVFQILPAGWIEENAATVYTVQYDIAFDEDCKDSMLAGVIPDYVPDFNATGSSGTPILKGSYAHVNHRGYTDVYALGNAHRSYAPVAGFDGGDFDNRVICKMFGDNAADAVLTKTQIVTVRVVYEVAGQTAKGEDKIKMTVYVKDASDPEAEFVKIEENDVTVTLKQDSSNREWNKDYTNTSGIERAMIFVMRGTTRGKGAAADINAKLPVNTYHNIYNSASGHRNGCHNITEWSGIGKESDYPLYREAYDASGTIYLDNFSVWVGNGDLPAGFTGAFLPTDAE